MLRPDVEERLELLRSECEGILSGFIDLFAMVAALVLYLANSPPSPGYEPLLANRGIHPILARGIARILVRKGKRTANDDAWRPAVVEAMHFLAGPCHNNQATTRRVHVLLTAWDQSSVVETIFDEADLDEFEFVRFCKSFAQGDRAVYPRLVGIATTLAPHLKVQRGRKVSAASVAHETLLICMHEMGKPQAFTLNEYKGEFTDPATKATCREFDLVWFDPRPARRRQRQRMQVPATLKTPN